jgi:hypothetical protein
MSTITPVPNSTAIYDAPLEGDASQRVIKENLQFVGETVGYFYQPLVRPVKACLAMCGAMALKDRTRPLSLILETPSGYGKTTVVEMFLPIDLGDPLGKYVYRSDKFTPKAFVSHAANRTEEQLAEGDLLPKLRNKIFATKELAPIFRGRTEELVERFSILISVLDGMGFTCDSGMRGQRGYPEHIMFNWLGATTPLPPETHRLMSQLGTRLLFYEVPAIFPSQEQLAEYAEREDEGEAASLCHSVVADFLKTFFQLHPIVSVPQNSIHISKTVAAEIARWARFLAQARAEVKCEKDDGDWQPVSVSIPEAPHKLVNYFKDIARGSALIEGRKEVNGRDLELVAHVSISSIPGHLRPIVRLLMRGGSSNTGKCASESRKSPKTARRYMQELELLEIAKVEKGSPTTNKPDLISLVPSLAWLEGYGS